jgi:hypothetical protein
LRAKNLVLSNPSQHFKDWLLDNEYMMLGLLGDLKITLGFYRLALLQKILLTRFNIQGIFQERIKRSSSKRLLNIFREANKYSSSLIIFEDCQDLLDDRRILSWLAWLTSLNQHRRCQKIHGLFYFHGLSQFDLTDFPDELVKNIFWLPINDLFPFPLFEFPPEKLPFVNFPHLPAFDEETPLEVTKAIELLFSNY